VEHVHWALGEEVRRHRRPGCGAELPLERAEGQVSRHVPERDYVAALKKIEELLASLPPEEQVAARHVLQGRPPAETADALRCSVGYANEVRKQVTDELIRSASRG
jgi:DNA-directed RNA polymerase specialized sigma24 family protein